MIEFACRPLPWNVIFETGSIQRLPAELEKLGFTRALLLCTPGQKKLADAIAATLQDRAVGIFSAAAMHVPSEIVTAAGSRAEELGADCTIAIGGGSTTGLGKALARRKSLPGIAIPTTYAGSEMTNIWGITEHGRKTTGRDDIVLPKLVIYDPELTTGLPPSVSACSGLNAMAQAIANVVSEDPNPDIESMAIEALRLLADSLPVVVEDPQNLDARSQALRGACLAGAALGGGSTGLHHRLCHVFGGKFNTPHAQTHAVLLPHTVAFNATALPDATAKVAAALGAANAPVGLHDLARCIGAPLSLESLGIRREQLGTVIAEILEHSPTTAANLTADRLDRMLQNAFVGRIPEAFD